MAQKTNSEIYNILKNAHHEYSYNYSLILDIPNIESKPPFLEYWKFADVLNSFDKPVSVNWQNIESIISSQTPQEYKINHPKNWTRDHLKNYQMIKSNNKPIEISRYAGWTVANYLSDFCDTSFHKAYFMNPGVQIPELTKISETINYATERTKISKNVSKINGIIGTLAEEYYINHSQISRDFWRNIYINLFGQKYNFDPKLSNKRGYLDYMDYKLLRYINTQLKLLIIEWDNNTQNKTPDHFIDMGGKYMNNAQQSLARQPITLISDKKLTPVAANFAKQEQIFIKQFIKPKNK